MKIDEIRKLKTAGDTLRNLRPRYLEKIKENSCDKYNLTFGGDDRFAVFQCTVFLDCHLGYYGKSSCSSMGGVDNALAGKLLNKALNKHMTIILETMAEMADAEAGTLVTQAQAELDNMQALINQAKAQ